MFKTYLPFRVTYAGTCTNGCDCVDVCPVETVTAEMRLQDLFAIGATVGDQEWIEKIEQGGKEYLICDVLAAHLSETVHRAKRHISKQDLKLDKTLKRMIGELNKRVNPPEPQPDPVPCFEHYTINIAENGSFHSEITRINKRDLENTLKRARRAFPASDGFQCEVYGIPYQSRYKLDM